MEPRKLWRREPVSSMDTLYNQLQRQQGTDRGVRLDDLAVGEIIQCPSCNQPIEVKLSQAAYKGRRMKLLSDCACVLRPEAAQAFDRASNAYQAETRSGAASDMRAIRHMTFDTFDWTRYPDANNPAGEARAWIDAVLPLPVADYHDGPVACLYFYSPGKGRGKTHLASAIAHVASAFPRSVTFANEMDWIDRYWAAEFELKRDMTDAAASRSWLTIIDDLGQRENPSAGLRNAWYSVFDTRWLKRGWTLVTSNWTPEQLLERGTINEATHSRLRQMMNGVIVQFYSGDYRLESANRDDA